MKGGKPPLPGPLLHKFVEEREKTPELSLHEPAVAPGTLEWHLEQAPHSSIASGGVFVNVVLAKCAHGPRVIGSLWKI
jgi:hypothetical protein